MKKIFIFIMLLILVTARVKAIETVNVELKYVPNVYHNYDKNGLNYWGQAAYIYANNEIAYCLDITTPVISSIYTLTDEVQTNNKILLAGYFGYGYNGEVSLKDYLATQKLIWGYLGKEVRYTTESNGKGKSINIDSYVEKILKRIEMYENFPKYDGNFEFELGSTNYINDLSNLEKEFNIINDSKNNISIKDNKLVIEANKMGKNKFYLETIYESKFDNKIYEASNSQKIMKIGKIDNLKKEYNYNITGGSIKLNVLIDGDKLESGGKLSENEFELYLSDKLIGKYKYDKEIYIDSLDYGKYILKHTKVSKGYKVDTNVYELEIKKDNIHIEKTIYIKPININVYINKTYGNKLFNILKYDEDVIYEVFDKNNNYITRIITDSNGRCSTNLYYGEYIIKQVNVNNVSIFHDNIIITKDSFDGDKIFNIYDDINKSKIRFIGIDRYTNEKIKDYKFEFNEFVYESNNGYYITSLMDYGTYRINNISSKGYKNIETMIFTINSDSSFYVVDNEIYVDVIIYLEKNEEVIEEPKIIEVEKIIEKEVEKIIEIEKEVPVEKIVEIEKEVPVNIVKEVEKIVEVEKDCNCKNECEKIEKLPFLGVNYEISKDYNTYYIYFKFSKLQII